MIALKFLEIAAFLERSQLVHYRFENKQLYFQLFHEGSARLYTFHVTTDTVHGRSIVAESSRSDCSMLLIDLGQRLEVKHGRYFPPTDSKQILQDARDRVTLAYGRRSNEHRWLLNLEGEYPLLSFLVQNLDEIQWEIE
jgi:hypothetical protein